MGKTTASPDLLIGAIGNWYNAIVSYDSKKAQMQKALTEQLLRSAVTDKKIQTYHQLVEFRHKIFTNEILRDPLPENQAHVDESIVETDQVLNYLYHLMEGRMAFQRENYLQSLGHYQKAERSIHSVSELERAEFFFLLGEGFYRINQYMHASLYLDLAKEIFELSSRHDERVIACTSLQASIYSELRLYHQAEEFFLDCLEQPNLKPFNRSIHLRAYGLHKERNGMLQDARDYYDEALHTGDQYDTLIGSKTKTNLANVLLRLGDCSGVALLEEAEEDMKTFNLVEFTARNRITRGLYVSSIDLLLVDQGLDELVNQELYFEATEAYEEVAAALETDQQFELALSYMRMANELRLKQFSIGINN
ncbi:hypothetical protein [Geomicrobium sediminis]|uniref:Response regulator aspartate phosphatase B n=1 Tax=Geomicrobium sediminis TaxID=1347788 RepID=A0ABS2P7K0_9BACL|nr:hypothetical protein [Geomicrobium sediminis]MBM7631388.1 response regulator aspartate phosphatase B [Geomicrobium sediminis]